MPNDISQQTKKIVELSENILKYGEDSPKIKEALKEINVLMKDISYQLQHEEKEKKEKLKPGQKKDILEELNITKEEVKKKLRVIKSEKEKKKESRFYKTNPYAKISNLFMENLAFSLIRKYPGKFKSLFFNLVSADIRILSRTYFSIILLTTAIAFPITLLIVFGLTLNILLALPIALLGSLLAFAITWYYPELEKIERGKRIKQELIFATVHMAAVAGSGAHPIKIFELLVESKEYKDIEAELQRILNYVHLFGYSLSTSLRAVASTTPSRELKELLHGMSSAIETGGSISDYLKEKADDSLIQYKFDQKKKLEALSTYSDIYTGILIAAPLLFIVTLAILEKISPEVGGMSISLIGNLLVFVALPLLNVFFIFFLSSVRSEL